jgi:hypothetical protein
VSTIDEVLLLALQPKGHRPSDPVMDRGLQRVTQ